MEVDPNAYHQALEKALAEVIRLSAEAEKHWGTTMERARYGGMASAYMDAMSIFEGMRK